MAMVGGIIVLLRRATTFRAYEDLVDDAREIGKGLRGEVFRDGDDLVVSGNQGRWPVHVRFSHAENTPGLDIRMHAPASFTLWVSARSEAAVEGRAQLRTGDPSFDARFATRSDHPTQANLLLGSKRLLPAIQSLCCSANTFLAITAGAIELTEVITPHPYTARHVQDHLESMAKLAGFLKTMPGAERYKIKPIRRERHIVGRLAISAGVLAAVVSVVAATENPYGDLPQYNLAKVPRGVLPVDAIHIPAILGYRLATAGDFDERAVSWLRANRRDASGRITGDFSGKGDLRDAAYVLVGKDGSRRVILLAGRESRYDIKYADVGIIARVPKAAVASIQWKGMPPAQVDGDGLLILRKSGDPSSALVVFISGSRVITATPAAYESINLD